MQKYFKLDSEGIPTPAKDIYDWSEWAVKHHRSVMTRHIGNDGLPVEIMTCFNYTEGYFQAFRLEGTLRTELEISKTKKQAELIHSKYEENLTRQEEK